MQLARPDPSHTGHDVAAVVTGVAWIFLNIINATAAGTGADMKAQMHHKCVKCAWTHTQIQETPTE